jgi:hypothetical protein
VEGEGLDLYAALFELGEDFGREVKAGCGRCGAAWLLGKDGLVAVAVLGVVVAVDVGRERHVADFVEDSVEVGSWGKAEGALAELSGGEDFGL